MKSKETIKTAKKKAEAPVEYFTEEMHWEMFPFQPALKGFSEKRSSGLKVLSVPKRKK